MKMNDEKEKIAAHTGISATMPNTERKHTVNSNFHSFC